MVQLITQFEIRATKACQLVMTKKEQVILKLEHGPLGIRNRETGGWMIQAIEGNYQAPLFYF